MANEKRLIDADVLMEEVYDSDEKHVNGVWHTGDIEYLVMAQQTVDVKPVVHGRWEIRSNPYRVFAHEYACSVCGGYKHKLSYEHENMNYCPNCGADMRERSEGE